MNASLLCALLSAFAVSSTAATAAASTDGSLPADIAAIPLCEQAVLSQAGVTLSTNERKKMCQQALGVEELLKISPTDSATLKAMCDNVACTAALKALYLTLPNCRYLDWAFKLSVESELKFCGIKPESIVPASSGSGSGGADSVGVANSTTTTKPPASWNSTSSSSGAAGSDFAPVGAPSPAPTTAAPTTQVPTTSPSSAASTLYATTATAALVVAATAAMAL